MHVHNFCTLFDKNYVQKGLALHASLLKHSSNPFVLYILAMDDETAKILEEANLKNVRILPLSVFESAMNMKPVRESRSLVEYFWTAASSLCEYLIREYPIDQLTYLDSDLFFFQDPQLVFDEIGKRSIAIIPHRLAEQDRNRLEPNGIYNVGWVTFRNDLEGLSCLTGWAALCREWCYARHDRGRFGDQAYLDSWPAEFGDALCIIQNIGACTAPWNLQQYEVELHHYKFPQAIDLVSVRIPPGPLKPKQAQCAWHPLVFYHFHEYRNESDLTRWPLRHEDKLWIYLPYISALRMAEVTRFNAQSRIEKRMREAEAEWQRA